MLLSCLTTLFGCRTLSLSHFQLSDETVLAGCHQVRFDAWFLYDQNALLSVWPQQQFRDFPGHWMIALIPPIYLICCLSLHLVSYFFQSIIYSHYMSQNRSSCLLIITWGEQSIFISSRTNWLVGLAVCDTLNYQIHHLKATIYFLSLFLSV